MTPIHTEKTFEESIEAHLLSRGGWAKGDPADYRRELGLAPQDVFGFVQNTHGPLAHGGGR